ncbi:hypothetical protein [Colwellia psychrerythraea]|uniref:Uncharacterized protein n=1 Tax=Colwellia psychrerythraea TaxID=28229 RepID=A0A099KQ39_COLPS|nr:hypothetical protein [Colwellia psychrerythraea]KGJ91753.1 hypothetical protein GAB14E_3235 [Colwellia psychrerythraea]
MKQIEKAIEVAYQNQISSLYGVLSNSILMADSDDGKLTEAEALFSKGLDFAADVRNRARKAAGL